MYSVKRIQVNDEDYRYLSDLERGISIARRHINMEDRVNYRITANTLIRIALEEFVKKARNSAENESNSFSFTTFCVKLFFIFVNRSHTF